MSLLLRLTVFSLLFYICCDDDFWARIACYWFFILFVIRCRVFFLSQKRKLGNGVCLLWEEGVRTQDSENHGFVGSGWFVFIVIFCFSHQFCISLWPELTTLVIGCEQDYNIVIICRRLEGCGGYVIIINKAAAVVDVILSIVGVVVDRFF